MRFESVVAHAFGPLLDETLELASGMNVVYGPNEAGKSSWHAALYAGLCGIRRGGGQRREDRDFADRHKPWNGGEAWEVSAIVVHGGGIRVELRHNLANRTGTARDADTGRDYAPDIIRDGAPDGAGWLGLDRRSFLATACVRQADIVSVRQAANSLQEVLQRAAATAGADATAAVAIDLLTEWHRDQVGSPQAYTKPLAAAKQHLQQSQDRLANARNAHEEYLHRRAEVERLHTIADRRRRELERMERDGPSRYPVQNAHLATQIGTALNEWSSLPSLSEPAGPSLAQLETALDEKDRQLAALTSANKVWGSLLSLAGLVAATTVAFRFGAMELLAFVILAFAVSVIAWRHRRSRRMAMLAERARTESDSEHRLDQDKRFREALSRQTQAEDALQRVADRAGIPRDETRERAKALNRWLQAWERELEQIEERNRRVDEARRDAARKRNTEERARGELDQFAKGMHNVSAAEESVQNARLAHERLRRLDSTLRTTIEFLRRAEEDVHRDMAPRLRASVCKYLSRITGGRYTDCQINPESLAVEVRSGNGPWRRAERLSHGTAEQIYLLLRMALAEHLSAPNEACPLILDDPIATSDASRREAILETLLAVSESTQVVLFTHDSDTRDWARERLKEPTGALRELDGTGIPA